MKKIISFRMFKKHCKYDYGFCMCNSKFCNCSEKNCPVFKKLKDMK